MANLETKKPISLLSLFIFISLSLLFFVLSTFPAIGGSASGGYFSAPIVLAFSASDASGFATQANTQIGAEDISVEKTAARIAKGVFSTAGIIFFLLMFYGGYTWLMARGEEEEVKKAQNIIIAACIGLFIMVGSYAFTNFVLSRMISGKSTPAASSGTTEPKGPLGCCLNEVQAPSGFWDWGSAHHWNSEIMDQESCVTSIKTCTKEDELCESQNGAWYDNITDKDACWDLAQSKPTN